MNEDTSTRTALIGAARDLFVRHGYDGTSIRAITSRAGVNLGAVTYHFGSKDGLYDAVAASVAEPLRAHLEAVAARPGDAVQRLDTVVRGLFAYLLEHPEVPGFVVQHLASSREPPPALRAVVEANMGIIAGIIQEGQAAGAIRDGDPRLLALSIAAQPIWLALVRRLVHHTFAIDQEQPETRAELIETAARFVRAGVTASATERS